MKTTEVLMKGISRLKRPPEFLISASAVCYYGAANNRVDEGSPSGEGDFWPVFAENVRQQLWKHKDMDS